MTDAAKKVLIAEDEKPLSKALSLKLTRSGFTVEVVGDGQQAIEKIQETSFDLLVLDLVMPRMDGFAVLEKLRELGQKPKIIVLSNLSQEEDAQRAKSLGADEYFIKSNTALADIVQHIKRLLGHDV